MKHCILAKFKPEVDVAALKPEIEAVFSKLLEMDGIELVEVIENVINRPNRYDLLIRITMDEATLPLYDDSEPHHYWKDHYGHLLEKKAIFDYK